jgi:tetratricopeptide (TPR) repeat protein
MGPEMLDRGILAAAMGLALCILACGTILAEVNNAGHGPYLGGDYSAALESYRNAQGRAPESGEPHYNSGNALYRMEEYEDALQSFDESLRHAAGELRSHGFFNRGNAAFQQEQYHQAVEAYKEVLRMDPDDRDAKHNLELALSRIPPEDQQQQDEQQQDEEEKEDEQEQEQEEKDESEEQQDQPITESQARQILESVGEAAQTLQERRGQVLVSPKPPSEFDW